MSPRPLHVLYGGAHLFSSGAPAKLSAAARKAFASWSGAPAEFARTVGVTDAALAEALHARVRDKLAARAIESMCIDFEDGYGPRPAPEEDADAVRAAKELALVAGGDAAPAIGIRIKALAGPTRERAERTLTLFLETLAASSKGLPNGFSVTLPKPTAATEVAALAGRLDALERRLGLPAIDVELMIESPRALLDAEGRVPLAAFVAAGGGRVRALHLGAYDLTAEMGVAASDQRLDHPFCDQARTTMQLALAGGGVVAVDGATTLLPIAPKDARPDDAEVRGAIHRAWALHARNVTRALDFGIWQGWDLHPAQLPARWGALAGYFLSRHASLAARLRAFVERATQASRVGQDFDDAATGLGLLTFFRRGLAAGVFDEGHLAATSLTREELELRSFAELVARRAGAAA